MEANKNRETTRITDSFLNLAPIVCAIMVIGLHSYSASSLPMESAVARAQGFLSHGIFMLAVPIFCFISGFLFFRNVNSVHDIFAKQLRRVKTLLIPFLAWSGFYYLFYAVGNHVLSIPMVNPVDISMRGIIYGVCWYQYCFPLWYLFQIIVFAVMAPVIYYLLRSKKATVTMMIVMAVISIAGLDGWEIRVGSLERTLFHFNFFGYYLLGCYAGKEEDIIVRFVAVIRKIPFAVVSILFAVVCWVNSLFFDGVLTVPYSRLLVPAVFLTGMAIFLKAAEKWRFKKMLCCSTMFVYGVHSFVGQVIGRLIGAFIHEHIMAAYFTSWILTTVFSFTASYLLKRWLKPVHHVFSGFR